MTQFLRKSIEELLAMSSAEVRAYLGTLSVPEQKRVSTELYRARLSIDMQRIGEVMVKGSWENKNAS
jgi:hypothetical protein